MPGSDRDAELRRCGGLPAGQRVGPAAQRLIGGYGQIEPLAETVGVDADQLAAGKGWTFRQDGAAWRRVVASPEPQRSLEIQPITWLLERGAVVICAGGGGIPTMHRSTDSGALVGVEAVIDKDLASELLAEDVDADLLLMACLLYTSPSPRD